MNVAWFGVIRATGSHYVPSWMEICISLGLVAGAILAFAAFVRHFPILASERPEARETYVPLAAEPRHRPSLLERIFPRELGRASLLFVLGMAVAAAALPYQALHGRAPRREPLPLVAREKRDAFTLEFAGYGKRVASFPHREHLAKIRQALGAETSCTVCHCDEAQGVINLPDAEGRKHFRACAQCHLYMESNAVPEEIAARRPELKDLAAWLRPGKQGALLPGYYDLAHDKKNPHSCLGCHADPRVSREKPEMSAGKCAFCHERKEKK
jgi:hypothetical protein